MSLQGGHVTVKAVLAKDSPLADIAPRMLDDRQDLATATVTITRGAVTRKHMVSGRRKAKR